MLPPAADSPLLRGSRAMCFIFLVMLVSRSCVVTEKVIHVIIGTRVVGCSNSASLGGTVVDQARSFTVWVII